MSNASGIRGLHHITAIASDPQRNLRFYSGTLGLRLVKKTVNFDDPTTYHLYYGDGEGRPGTILTFFPWPNAIRGRSGPGQTRVAALAVPVGSLSYWQERLGGAGVETGEPIERFAQRRLAFADPDGMEIELVELPEAETVGAIDRAGVPAACAIRGIAGATLDLARVEPTAELLTRHMGYVPAGQDGNLWRFEHPEGGLAAALELNLRTDGLRGNSGAGTIHHIAFRTPDDPTQHNWRNQLADMGFGVSQVMDRQYFHSIYFREPGGVLFEIATDPPGFTADEPLERLGEELRLPEWYEPMRERIAARLPRLEMDA